MRISLIFVPRFCGWEDYLRTLPGGYPCWPWEKQVRKNRLCSLAIQQCAVRSPQAPLNGAWKTFTVSRIHPFSPFRVQNAQFHCTKKPGVKPFCSHGTKTSVCICLESSLQFGKNHHSFEELCAYQDFVRLLGARRACKTCNWKDMTMDKNKIDIYQLRSLRISNDT